MKAYTIRELKGLKFISLVYLLDVEVLARNRLHNFYKVGYSRDIVSRINSLRNLEKPSSEVRGRDYYVTKIECIGLCLEGNSLELEQKFHRGIDFRLRYLGNYLANGNSEIYKKDNRVLEFGLGLGIKFE